MEKGIFQFIWRYSRKQQITIMLMTLASLPFLYLVLDLPKYIINDAIDGNAFPKQFLGFDFAQVEYLLLLCTGLLALLIINAYFSMKINTYKGVSSERLIRRLRYQLYENILRFPQQHFQKVTPAELSAMITAEVEPMGDFISDSFSMPMVQGGTMLTILFFMISEDPILGLVAISMVPVQAWVIPKLQIKVNQLGRERVVRARKLAGWVGESVLGIGDIHTNDASTFMQASISKKLGAIFKVRYQLYQKKFFMKALNVFLSQLTPLFFYSIGGILVINGSLTLGALVAILAAYNRFTTPWKELLKYYQRLNDVKIKYEQLIEQFQPGDMMDIKQLSHRPDTLRRLNERLELSNVRFVDEGTKVLEGVTIEIEPGDNIAIVAEPATRDKFAHLIARLITPSSGNILVGQTNLSDLPEAVTGASIGYAGPESFVFSGTVDDNILYGTRHIPVANGALIDEQGEEYLEALASGNSAHDIEGGWIDLEALGLSDKAALQEWTLKVIQTLELDDLLMSRFLGMKLDASENPELADRILMARQLIATRLSEHPENAELTCPYKFDQYNANASVAANLVYGVPVNEVFEYKTLGGNPLVRAVLDECELTHRFVTIGHGVAEMVIDLFGDMSADQPLFENFSFVDEETLQQLKDLTSNVDGDELEKLDEDQKNLLVSLTFQLIVDRHRFGFIDEDIQERILEARRLFREKLPEEQHAEIAFFDQEEFNSQLTNRSNLLVGTVNQTINNAEERLNEITVDALKELGLVDNMILYATGFNVGVSGSKLSHADKQKIAVARSIIKKPDILVNNDALSSMDRDAQARIRENVYKLLPDTTFIYFFSEMPEDSEFKQVLSMRDGRIVERYVDDHMEALEPVAGEGEEVVEHDPGASSVMVNVEAAALAHMPLFSSISTKHLKLLAFSSKRIHFEKDQNLIDEGVLGKFAFVILEGEVDIVIGSGKKEKIINHYAENELIGELSLLTNAMTTATVRASTPVTALRIEKDVFLQLMKGDGQVATQVAGWVSDRLVRSMKLFSKAA